jgi:ribulose kinase
VWGPYYNALVPGRWLLEGGESATGALVDHIIDTHPASPAAKEAARAQNIHLHEYLHIQLRRLQQERQLADIAFLTRDVHVLPYFHGNRSPRADPSLLGVVSGLSLACDVSDLAVKYLATLQALAYGTRHILDAMREKGVTTRYLFLTGGLAKNELFVQQHAGETACDRGHAWRMQRVGKA